jgi:hypothetical protein
MKKRVLMSMAVLVSMIGPTLAHAQTRSGFEVGAETFAYNYRESFEGDSVKDDGRFLGFDAAYTRRFDNALFVRGELALAFGSVDYTADGGQTRLDDVEQATGRLELHLGRDFAMPHGASISPFIGLGSRALIDESGGKQASDGSEGYDRTISYAYVPVGAAATFALRGNATLTLAGQYNWFVRGHSESLLSDVDSELPDVNVRLNDGLGYELSAMVNLPVGSRRLSVGPFIRRWNTDQSESFAVDDEFEFFEPESRTTETGIRLSFAF